MYELLDSAAMTLQEAGNSLECIRKCELFPMKKLITEDESLQVPFPLLMGECVEYLGRISDHGIIALSNFRILIRFKDSFVNLPLRMVDMIETRDIFYLNIYCKDASIVRCAFSTNDSCQEWYKRLHSATAPPKKLEELFAFAFHAWCADNNPCTPEQDSCYQLCQQEDLFQYSFGNDVDRMKFDLKTAWRITYINDNYTACASYPQLHIVPASVTDNELAQVAGFRALRRFPSVVWRDQRNGAVLVRSSQPEVGWFGWREPIDENLVQAIALACAQNSGGGNTKASSSVSTDNSSLEEDSRPQNAEPTRKRVLIIDARSYGAAFANRAKGGGSECAEYYQNCEIQFMNLANIHSIRKSFIALRTLCGTGPDQPNWFSALENTKWLHYVSSLLKAASLVVTAVDKDHRPVLVHCSDGWDRTPQIIALCELLLDPYYRTVEGFQVLVSREWLAFGHKFADRCGHGTAADDGNERCPVFLQWLDCIYQVVRQFPCSFQFNEAFLVKLVQHTYSCLFGTFLCNSVQDREATNLSEMTAPVWALLRRSNRKFHNFLYSPGVEHVIYPSCHLRSLSLWSSVYLSNNSSMASPDDGHLTGSDSETNSVDMKMDAPGLQKTRSCDDIVAALEHSANVTANRRLSDPSLGLDIYDQFQNSKEKEMISSVVNNDVEVAGSSEEAIDNRISGESDERVFTENVSDDIYNGINKPPENGINDCVTENGNIDDTTKNDIQCNVFQNKDSDVEPVIGNGHLTNGQCDGNTIMEHGDVDSTLQNGHISNGIDGDIEEEIDVDVDINGRINGFHENNVNGSQLLKNECALNNGSRQTDDEDDVIVLSSTSSGDNSSPAAPYSGGHGGHSVESSTDTITDEDPQSFQRRVAPTDNISVELNGHTVSGDDVIENRTDINCDSPFKKLMMLRLGTLEQSANVSTSTSDISDSFVEAQTVKSKRLSPCTAITSQPVVLKLNCSREAFMQTKKLLNDSGSPSPVCQSPNVKASCPTTPGSESRSSDTTIQRHLNSLGRHLDVDGLTNPGDSSQQRLQQVVMEHERKAEVLESQVQAMRATLVQYVASGPGRGLLSDGHDDILSIPESTGSGELHSIGNYSNAASDVSWEQVEEDESRITKWVPDHVVTHCADCQHAFSFIRRRHHCRNCGEVFCAECTNYYMPVPHQQLTEPSRVCKGCFHKLEESHHALLVDSHHALLVDERPIAATV